MQNQSAGRKPGGRLRIKLEPPCCDQCRTDKVSCRSPQSVDERCGRCEENNLTCSWVLGPRPSGRSPPSPSYVAYLETQVGKLEKKLREILPGINLNRELETLAGAAPPRVAQPAVQSSVAPAVASLSNAPTLPASPPRVQPEDSHGVSAAAELLKQVRLTVKSDPDLGYSQHNPSLRKDTYWSETASTRPKEPRYHGQSSGEILLRDAKELKQEYEELSLSAYEERSAPSQHVSNPPAFWTSTGYPQIDNLSNIFPSTPFPRPKPPRVRIRQRRPEFWQPTPPEQRALARDVWATGLPSLTEVNAEPHFSEVVLPPPDLLHSLVDLFFIHANAFAPILHRQSFEQELARGTHLLQVLQRRALDRKNGIMSNDNHFDSTVDQTRGAGTFARLVLMVCACASKWSSDPRVLASLPEGKATELNAKLVSLSAGYPFFRQVDPWCRTWCAQAGLWDMQIYFLLAAYLHASSACYGAWIVVGIAIRFAQDIGAHRKKDGNTIENELYKRSFWALLVLDRFLSGVLGRPAAMQDLESDLEDPIEVDDEYWPISGEPNQPGGKPSRISYFNCMIGLSRVLGKVQQTVFAIGRTKRQMELIEPEKKKMLLQDLQGRMGEWRLTVPYHLRLPHPGMLTPPMFLAQAVSLWATYHNIMILIHRPFITIKSSPLAAESLEICRSSARECARMLESYLRVGENTDAYVLFAIQPAFSSAMVLLVDILATKNAEKHGASEYASDTGYPLWEKEQDVERCMRVLACAEHRWRDAGRLHDILREFQRSGRISPFHANAQTEYPNAVVVNTAPSTFAWDTARQPHQTPFPSFLTDTSMTNPNFGLQPEKHVYARSESSQTSISRSSVYDPPTLNFESPTHFGPATLSQPLTQSKDYLSNYASSSRIKPTNLAHSNPVESHWQHREPHLEGALYNESFHTPFPGSLPQLYPIPNLHREVEPEDALGEREQNPEWTTNTRESSSLSQWETMKNNTMYLARTSRLE